MSAKLPDPRRTGDFRHWPRRQRQLVYRGMLLGMISKSRNAMMNRDWSILTGAPIIRKTVQSMRSDNVPIREIVQIGSVRMVFDGSQFVGFEKDDTKLMLPSARSHGLNWPEATTSKELVRRLYLALAEETTRNIEEWVDHDLEGDG